MKKAGLLLLFCCLFGTFTFAQSATKSFQSPDDLLKESDQYAENHDFEKSLEYARKAILGFSKSQNWTKYFEAYEKVIRNLTQLYNLDEAFREVEKSLEEIENYKMSGTLEEANLLNKKAKLLYLKADYRQARLVIQEALAITETRFQHQHLTAAYAYILLGNIELDHNHFYQARQHFEKAMAIDKIVAPNNHLFLANCEMALGNVHRSLGHYTLALNYYEDALEIHNKYIQKENLELALCYTGIAQTHQNLGSYDLAKEYFQQAILINQKIFGEHHPYLADTYLGLADIMKLRGKFDEALEYYEKVESIFRRYLIEKHIKIAEAYLGKGNVFAMQAQYQKARIFYDKVLEINAYLENNHVGSSAAYNNIASLYYYNGDYAQAIAFYEKGLRKDYDIYGNHHPDIANTYYNIGRLYAEKGNYAEAMINSQYALVASVDHFENKNIFVNPPLRRYFDHNDLLWYLSFKAEVLQKGFSQEGKINVVGLKASLETYKLCDTLIDRIRVSHLSREDQIELGKKAAQIYAGAAYTNYLLYQNIGNAENSQENAETQKKQILENIFYFSEKNKAFVLSSSISESNAKKFAGIPENVLEKEEHLAKQISEYRQILADMPDSLTVEIYTDKLFKINRQHEDLLREIEKKYPKYHEIKYNLATATVKQFEESLDNETAVLSYFITEKQLYLNILTKEGLDVQVSSYSKEIDDLMRKMRNSIFYNLDKVYGETAFRLHKVLFPKKLPENIKKVVIIPDGLMLTIPLEALLTDLPNAEDIKNKNHKNFPFLIKKYEISYAFSSNLLYFNTLQNNKKEKWTEDWIGIAPVFDNHIINKLAKEQQDVLSEVENASSSAYGANKLQQFGNVIAIPATKDEVQTIEQKFLDKKYGAKSLLYGSASEKFVKSANLKNYRYLHIATHGFANSVRPELCGLILAKEGDEDGILYSGEIYNMELNAELVVLSACETGLGKITKGEGMIGLTRSLLYAGAQNLIVSLWKVADASTSQMMIDFYEHLLNPSAEHQIKGVNFGNPLRQAKLQLISQGKYAAPYYWSPFVLVGK